MRRRLRAFAPFIPLAFAIIAALVALAGQLADIFKLDTGYLLALAAGGTALTILLSIGEHRRTQKEALHPPLRLDVFPVTDATALHYRARRVPLTGYKEPLQLLTEFLEANRSFLWWVVTGPAGAGKSRIALEFCLGLTRGWDCGFLPKGAFSSWEQWTPRKSTLIVVDYASARIEEVASIISALEARNDALPRTVRLLLLERSVDHDWWEKMLGVGGERMAAEMALHDAPLVLQRLDPDAIWETIKAVFVQQGAVPSESREDILSALLTLDPLGRPLYVLMAADALAAGRNIGDWDKFQLLRYVLDRNEQLIWRSGGVTERDKNLLAFATMLIGGLNLNVLPRLQKLDLLNVFPTSTGEGQERFSPERYGIMTGQDSRIFLAPLEPDLVGEFFVLQQLEPRDSIDVKRAALLNFLAWHLSPAAMFEFVTRVLDDFPDHPAVRTLTFFVNSTSALKLLEITSPTKKEELATLIAAAAGNIAFAQARAGRCNEARTVYDDLVSFASLTAEYAAVHRIAYVTAIRTAECFGLRETSSANQMITRLANHWKEHGTDQEELQWIVQVFNQRIGSAVADLDYESAKALIAGAVAFAELCDTTYDPETLPESLLSTLHEVAARRDVAAANAVFDLIAQLGDIAVNPPLAKARALGAFVLITLLGDQGHSLELIPRIFEVYSSGKAAVDSTEFELAFDGNAEVLRSARSLFAAYSELFIEYGHALSDIPQDESDP